MHRDNAQSKNENLNERPAASSNSAARPPEVPEKFWDAEKGEVRVDALLKSYGELERKMGGMIAFPVDDADEATRVDFLRRLGVPETPDDYSVETVSDLLASDPEVNARLHAAGFTPAQVQLVYDLAEDYVIPALEQVSADFEGTRQSQRLTDHFGGEAKWRQVAGQLRAWGQANLPEEVLETLSGTFEGVLALHNMMKSGEPGIAPGADGAGDKPDETELNQLMRDPRYWRDRDPAFVARVTRGFEQLYSG